MCVWKLKARSESDLPAGQRCAAGYRLVAVASQGALRQRRSTQILLTEALEPLTSGKAERHFIIHRDEIHFHSRYTNAHSDDGVQRAFQTRNRKKNEVKEQEKKNISLRRLQHCTFLFFKKIRLFGRFFSFPTLLCMKIE